MAVSPNGQYLATTNNSRADAIELYDFKTGTTRTLTSKGIPQFYDYRMSCVSVAFSPNSKTLVHGGEKSDSSGYSAINTWDTATGAHLKTFALTTVGQNVLWTPDGKNIVAADRDKKVYVWNARTGQAVKTIPGPGGSIVSLAVSPDGRRVAIGTVVPDCVVQVRDLRSGHTLWTQTVAMPEGVVSSLAFSPDGRTLARGGQNNIIYLHEARTGQVRTQLSDHRPGLYGAQAGMDNARTVQFSPDGRFLACGGPDKVLVWSAVKNKLISHLQNSREPFAFLPSSRFLVATQSDRPAPHLPNVHAFPMLPPRRNGNVALWPLP